MRGCDRFDLAGAKPVTEGAGRGLLGAKSGDRGELAEDQVAERVGDVIVVAASGTVRRGLDRGQDLVQVVVGDLFLGAGHLLEPLPGHIVGGVGRLQPELRQPVAECAPA